jgi:hypothetical protein
MFFSNARLRNFSSFECGSAALRYPALMRYALAGPATLSHFFIGGCDDEGE